MASVPAIDPTNLGSTGPKPTEAGAIANTDPNPEGCKNHCHYPTAVSDSYTAGSEMTQGCPCMTSHKRCDFEWDSTGRGFCKNCHHANSLTVKASTCKLDF